MSWGELAWGQRELQVLQQTQWDSSGGDLGCLFKDAKVGMREMDTRGITDTQLTDVIYIRLKALITSGFESEKVEKKRFH